MHKLRCLILCQQESRNLIYYKIGKNQLLMHKSTFSIYWEMSLFTSRYNKLGHTLGQAADQL